VLFRSIRGAFLASGRSYAGDAWSGVERVLDAYTRSWTGQRKEACEATQVRGEQSQELLDLRMHCLDRRLGDLRSLTALLSTGAPDVVERAVAASQNLPGLAGCADTVALTAPVPPPSGEAERREVDRLEGELAAARALWTTGRYGEALQSASGAVTRAARLGYAPDLAEALHTRFLAEDALNTFEQAEETLFAALTAGQRGHHDALVARGWIDLVWETGFRQRKYGEAKRWAEMATASLERLGGAAENPVLDADLKSNLGATLDQEGEHETGIALLREALPLYQKSLGPDDPAVSRTLNRLGTAYYNLKRYDQALDAYRRALEATRRTLGARHPTVAVRLGNMSLVLQDQGKLEESLGALLESKAIEEAALGPTHPRLAITHSNLASLLADMGRPAEALEHARRAVAIDEVNDPDPADAGASWSNVADDLFLLGRYAEAAEAARKARDLMVRGEETPAAWIAAVNTTLGRSLFAQGKKTEAIAPLRQALAGFRAGGEESLALAHAQSALAAALWETGGDRAEALSLARQAREITARYPRARAHEVPTLDAWLAERGGG
jgi:tetratricopeptide (TPR) repeat protein